MKRCLSVLAVLIGCGSAPHLASEGAPDGGARDGASPDGGASEANPVEPGDPRCGTRPIPLPDHPTAPLQASEMGKSLRNIRAWNGRLYFGYGDLNLNTGPITIASLDPVAKTWMQHLVLETESIERYVQIGDELWATCADDHDDTGTTGCEYGSGDANHQWTTHDIGVHSVHVMDTTERVPGEALLAGSSLLDGGPAAAGAFIWRSQNGGAFTQIFPAGLGDIETSGGPFTSIVTFDSVAYAVTGGSVWTWDGTTWRHARAPGDDADPLLFGEFIHPVTFAGHIVFGGFGGYLFAFDGKTTEPLNIRSFQTPTQMGFTEEPVVIFEEAEDHLLAVNEAGDVVATNDLKTWTCIGKAPADVRSVGAMNGVVYFGGADGHVYAFPDKSW
jgi:hypothetical protein